MKTSLVIDDKVFQEAKKEAAQSRKTISEVISLWARVGREAWKTHKHEKKQMEFHPVNLGQPQVDLANRKNWMEELEDDRN